MISIRARGNENCLHVLQADLSLFCGIVGDGFAIFYSDLPGDIDSSVVDDGGGVVSAWGGKGFRLDVFHFVNQGL